MKLVLASVVIYVVYMVGMVGVYLFSMPGAEATNLAGSERYRNTIFIAIYYLFFLFSLTLISTVENRKKGWIYLVGLYASLFIIWAGEGEEPFPVIFTNTVDEGRTWFEEVMESKNVPVGASYLVCSSTDEYARYIYHLCRYFLWSDHSSYMVVTDRAQLDKYAGEFEYILLYDNDNPIIQEWVNEHYPEQEGKSVIVNMN